MPVDDATQDGHAFYGSIVQYLDELRLGVTEGHIRFIKHQCATEGIERVKYWRSGGSATGEEGLIAKRSDGDEPTRLARTVIAPQA